MEITFLNSREEYEKWYMRIISPAEVDGLPGLLNPHEIEVALTENQPSSFPCMAYRQKSEFNCLDEEIVFVYEEEFSLWVDQMGKVKR
jgi:hypothetical protein